MTIGTKSVLFGAHCFFLHPFFVAAAWTKLYGFPFDPRLWVAFFVHDIGYFGKPNLDGQEGETHPEFGAFVMHELFDFWMNVRKLDGTYVRMCEKFKWHDLALYHSRHYAKMHDEKPSRLCFADKLAFCYQWRWLYLKMTKLTGELDEYVENGKYWQDGSITTDPKEWYNKLVPWIVDWVNKHKDGEEDLVTVDRRFSSAKY